jgi:hypothetical protein
MAAAAGTSAHGFDVSAWLAPYKGMGRFNRLYHVAKQAAEPLRSQALFALLSDLKNTRNTRFYKDLIEEFADILGRRKDGGLFLFWFVLVCSESVCVGLALLVVVVVVVWRSLCVCVCVCSPVFSLSLSLVCLVL